MGKVLYLCCRFSCSHVLVFVGVHLIFIDVAVIVAAVALVLVVLVNVCVWLSGDRRLVIQSAK